MSLLRIVFLGFCICLAIKAELFKSVSWQLDSSQDVTTYQTIVTAASAISCITKRTLHSQCDSCAYDGESGTCYLQVQTASDSVGGSLQVFTVDYPCKESEAPVDYTTTSVTWRRAGWEMEGYAICNDDYMFSEDGRPAFHCSAIGTWTSNAGECRQRIWNNPLTAMKMAVPRAPALGWTVCVNGTSPTNNQFSVNFKSGNGDIVHSSIRLYTNEVVFNYNENGEGWNTARKYNIDPFPLVSNKSSLIEFKAIGLYEIQFFVDGKLYINYTLPWSLSSVKWVYYLNDAAIEVIDLWCDD